MYQNLEQYVEEKIQYYYDTYNSDITPSEEAFLRTALRQCAELTVEAIFVDKLPTTVPGAILEAGYWLNKE